MLYTYHYNLFITFHHCQKEKKKSHFPFFFHWSLTTNPPSVCMDTPILDISQNGMLAYVFFYDGLLIINIMFSVLIHVVPCISTSFFL